MRAYRPGRVTRTWTQWILLVLAVVLVISGVALMALAHRHRYLGFGLFIAGIVGAGSAARILWSGRPERPSVID